MPALSEDQERGLYRAVIDLLQVNVGEESGVEGAPHRRLRRTADAQGGVVLSTDLEFTYVLLLASCAVPRAIRGCWREKRLGKHRALSSHNCRG